MSHRPEGVLRLKFICLTYSEAKQTKTGLEFGAEKVSYKKQGRRMGGWCSERSTSIGFLVSLYRQCEERRGFEVHCKLVELLLISC